MVMLAGTVVLVRMLGSDEFGRLTLVQTTLTMVGICAAAGLGPAVTKYTAELRTRDSPRLGRVLAFVYRVVLWSSGICAVLLALFSSAVAERMFNMPELAPLLAFASISVVFAAVAGYQTSALIGFEAIRENALGGLAATVMTIAITICLTFLLGLVGAVAGLVVGAMVQYWIGRQLLFVSKKKFDVPAAKTWTGSERAILGAFGVPSVLSQLMGALAMWISQSALARTTHGASEVALIGVAMQWVQVVSFVPAMAGAVLLPVLADTFAGGTPGKGIAVLRAASIANALVAIPIAGVICIASGPIMSLYGAAFSSHQLVLMLAVGAAALSTICAPIGQLLAAKGRMWVGWAMNAGWAVVFVTLSFAWADSGAFGFFGAMIVAYLLHLAWAVTWAWRYAGI